MAESSGVLGSMLIPWMIQGIDPVAHRRDDLVVPLFVLNPSSRIVRSSRVFKGTSMKVSIVPAGAPNGRNKSNPKSLTIGSTARSADVARVSCSSGPVIPEVGMSLAGCHVSSATGTSQYI